MSVNKNPETLSWTEPSGGGLATSTNVSKIWALKNPSTAPTGGDLTAPECKAVMQIYVKSVDHLIADFGNFLSDLIFEYGNLNKTYTKTTIQKAFDNYSKA